MITIYHRRPEGKKEVVVVSDVYPEDKKFFEDNNIVVEAERAFGQYVLAADLGILPSCGSHYMEVVWSQGRTSAETIKELRGFCEDFSEARGIKY